MPLVRGWRALWTNRRMVSRLVVHRLSLAQFRLLANPQLPRSPLGRPCSAYTESAWALLMVVACALAAFHWTSQSSSPARPRRRHFHFDGAGARSRRTSPIRRRASRLAVARAMSRRRSSGIRNQVIKALSDYQRMAQETGEQLIILPETAWPVSFHSLPQEYVARAGTTSPPNNKG